MLALIAVQRQTAILRSTRPWRREQHGCTAGDPMVALTKLSTLAHTPSLRASPVTDDDFPDVHPTFYFITGKYMLFSKGCKLVGCGSAVPSLSVSNDDLAKIVDTSDEWIFFCTGIRNRRVVSDHLFVCVLATLIYVVRSKEFAACSGFMLGLFSASCYIRGGGLRNVLVIRASDVISRFVDWIDRGTCILFGDAGGAVVVQACDAEEDSLLSFDLHSDCEGARHLGALINDNEINDLLGSNGSALEFPPKRSSYACIQMNGKEVQRCTKMLRIVLWIISFIDLANYGNTSAASIPLALDEAVRSGKVKPGHTIVASGFGAGLTWGSAVIKWG
ncbi:3-oxoacyl-[acyl-carrier-protein] synthase 3 A, chloroplastic-like [Hibiscus syriacus]|uniref:3-oxoacyl-[acyl-carrier-protein] synthase 3 A, chloroplastic-like n=1 Tax=Hibiscus syriacus TaxID=106335 RepID=UPI001924200C|nr:3-oxoacyl-[acyl-carrier-protein] synthase 3 A, chloroplastic-like [Hibiscus syriacus]